MKEKSLIKLFTSTFMLSAFTFGGGFVIIPLMRKKFVKELHWIEDDEMLDLVSIAQSSPGALTINASIIIGYKVKGIKGALVATLGSVLPPLFIISIIAYFYEVFITNPLVLKALMAMNIGIAAILIDVVTDLFVDVVKDFKWYAIFVTIAVFIASLFKVNIIIIILSGGILGLVYFLKFYHVNLGGSKDE